jgi:hypothetical protein
VTVLSASGSTRQSSPDKDIVTPNNDTPYSYAWLDLRAEPCADPAEDRRRAFLHQPVGRSVGFVLDIPVRSTTATTA